MQNILAGKCPEIALAAVADRGRPASSLVPHCQHPVTMRPLPRACTSCEKPAGVYTKAVQEMNEAAESGRVFGMMFNQRTNCVYRKNAGDGPNGQLELKRVNWIITDWYRTPRSITIPETARHLGGRRRRAPESVPPPAGSLAVDLRPAQNRPGLLQRGQWHDIEVEDDVTAYLQFENGATGVFITTTGDAPGTNLRVTGTWASWCAENNPLTF